MKLFWKEVSEANVGKVENSNRIKDQNGRLVLEEADVQRNWEQVAVLMCGFAGVQRRNYFGREPNRTEVEVSGVSLRMERLQLKMRSHRDNKRWR